MFPSQLSGGDVDAAAQRPPPLSYQDRPQTPPPRWRDAAGQLDTDGDETSEMVASSRRTASVGPTLQVLCVFPQ